MSPDLIVAAGTAGAALIAALVAGLVLVVRTLREVRHELRPNTGTSARDAINRTDAETQSQSITLDLIAQQLNHVTAAVTRLAQVDEDDRAVARAEHKRIWAAIKQKEMT